MCSGRDKDLLELIQNTRANRSSLLTTAILMFAAEKNPSLFAKGKSSLK